MKALIVKSKPLLLVIVAVGLAILFVPRVDYAIEWLWETVTVPQAYITDPATFRDVVMMKSSSGAYAGWIVGEPHGPAKTDTTLLQYTANKWQDASSTFNTEIAKPGGTIITLTDIDGVYYNGGFRVYAVGKKTTGGVDSGVVYQNNGFGWVDRTPAAGLAQMNAVTMSFDSAANDPDGSGPTPPAGGLTVIVGGDNNGPDNNIWKMTTNAAGSFTSWERIDTLGMNSNDQNITALGSVSLGPTQGVYAWAATKFGTDSRIYRNFNLLPSGSKNWANETATALANTDINDLAAVTNTTTGIFRVRAVGATTTGTPVGVIYNRIATNNWGSPETLPGSPALPPLHGVTGVFDATLSEYDFWAVGNTDTDGNVATTNDTDNAAVLFNFHNDAGNGTWVRQDSHTGPKSLMGIDAASRVKVAGVGSNNALIMNSPGNIFGWGWFGSSTTNGSGDSIGWVSLNCVDRGICETNNFSYGINIAPTGFDQGVLSGYAWIGDGDVNQYKVGDCGTTAPNIGKCLSDTTKSCITDFDCRCSQNPAVCKSTGWISFNKTDTGTPPAAPYNNGSQSYVSFYDAASRQVSGWARILAFAPGGTGWVKLRGNAVTPPAGTYSMCGDCVDGAGSLANGTGTCSICDVAPGTINYSCNACTGCNGTTETCTACGACNQYGVSVNESNGKVSGFAWSQDYGWLDFTHANYYSTAWVQTRFGDIYSRADIGSGTTPTAPGLSIASNGSLCNATYLIQARGTITNFCSESSTFTPPLEDPLRSGSGADNFGFPDASSRYTNALGSLDFNKMVTITSASPTSSSCSSTGCIKTEGTNVYGEKVIRYTGQTSGVYYLTGYETTGVSRNDPILGCIFGSQIVTLNDTVYYFDGDLIANDAWSSGTCSKIIFTNGTTATNTKGQGMFVTTGKIVINKQIEYGTTGFNQLNELASAVFMSKDSCVVFDQNASTVVGTYYAGGVCNWPTDTTKSAGIHIVNNVTQSQFELHGLMIAKSFDFGRTYKGTVLNPEPAEKVFYDGRIIINPPAGLQDFSLGFPSFRQISP